MTIEEIVDKLKLENPGQTPYYLINLVDQMKVYNDVDTRQKFVDAIFGTNRKTVNTDKSDKIIDFMKKVYQSGQPKSNARGGLYQLEVAGIITKDEFKSTGVIITKAIKDCRLPLNLFNPDVSRQAISYGFGNSKSLEEQYQEAIESVGIGNESELEKYTNVHFELIIEKGGMADFFEEVNRKFELTFSASKGCPDIHSRVDLLNRLADAVSKGYKCVVLSMGDLDPSGQHIMAGRPKQVFDLIDAAINDKINQEDKDKLIHLKNNQHLVDWQIIGLTDKQIEENNIPWIDGLTTSSGNDSSKNGDVNKAYVKNFIKKYGKRKCEMDSIAAFPGLATSIVTEAVMRYINQDDIDNFTADQTIYKDKVRQFKLDKKEELLRGAVD
jgi:hypothetical protein